MCACVCVSAHWLYKLTRWDPGLVGDKDLSKNVNTLWSGERGSCSRAHTHVWRNASPRSRLSGTLFQDSLSLLTHRLADVGSAAGFRVLKYWPPWHKRNNENVSALSSGDAARRKEGTFHLETMWRKPGLWYFCELVNICFPGNFWETEQELQVIWRERSVEILEGQRTKISLTPTMNQVPFLNKQEKNKC